MMRHMMELLFTRGLKIRRLKTPSRKHITGSESVFLLFAFLCFAPLLFIQKYTWSETLCSSGWNFYIIFIQRRRFSVLSDFLMNDFLIITHCFYFVLILRLITLVDWFIDHWTIKIIIITNLIEQNISETIIKYPDLASVGTKIPLLTLNS